MKTCSRVILYLKQEEDLLHCVAQMDEELLSWQSIPESSR
jgi:hypothetical protein